MRHAVRAKRNAMLQTMLDADVLAPERIRPLTVRDFEALIAGNVFDDDAHSELLRGVLVEMSPQGDPHSAISGWLLQIICKALPIESYDVRGHSPFAATEDSMPEPDVFVAPRARRAGRPSRALLLIEVADSSLQKDRIIKSEIYAEGGVPEYWIVNVNAKQVEVLTRPSPKGYGHREVITTGALRPMKVPNVKIVVDDIPWAGVYRAKRSP